MNRSATDDLRRTEAGRLRGRLSFFACLSLLLTLVAAAASAQRSPFNLPDIGAPSGGILSPIEDEKLGLAFMRHLRQSVRIVDDPEIEQYIQSLGQRLAARSDSPGQRFHFFAVDDPTINAFAGPGGYIGVHTGLITETQSESELAAVVAHEIAHVTQRHLQRSFAEAKKLNLPVAAALLAALVLGTQSAELGQAAAMSVQAGSLQYQINFTRANEKEADYVGIQTLANAGFDPRSMAVFFERMQQAHRYYGSGVPEFLRTHPVTVNRIADSRARAESYAHRQYSDSLAYHLVRAKIKVLDAKDPAEALEYFGKALADGRHRSEAATRYGYALALLRARRLDDAEKEIDRLLSKDPDRIAYRIANAEIALARGQRSKALKVYREALQIYPGNYPLTMYYANALLSTGKSAEAYELLERYVAKRKSDPVVYALLAKAAGEAGHSAQGHQYQGEHYYLTGNTEAAVRQLEIALRASDTDFYQRSQVEARLHELKKIAEKEKKASRH
jgi:predicted Zn-dependent protease